MSLTLPQIGLTQFAYSDQIGSEQPVLKRLEQFLAASSQVSAGAAKTATAQARRQALVAKDFILIKRI
jgi:hypothetical protein